MATVKLSKPLRSEILGRVSAPFKEKLSQAEYKLQAFDQEAGEAFYEAHMPKEHIAAWASLPDEWKNAASNRSLTVCFGPSHSHRYSIGLKFPAPMPIQIAMRAQAYTLELGEFMENFPEVAAVTKPVIEDIKRLVAEEAALCGEVKKAMESCVTLNRLLKAVPAFQRYVPPRYIEQMNKTRGPPRIDKDWTPDDLQAGLLRGNVLTSA